MIPRDLRGLHIETVVAILADRLVTSLARGNLKVVQELREELNVALDRIERKLSDDE